MAKKAKAAKNGGPKPVEAQAASERKPMLRAIRVTPEVLEAAKVYKKAKGVSFYALGLECISNQLAKEGYLKKA